MTRTRPRTLSTSEERRDTVLRTAVETFASRGYYGTTTTEVATRAGISQAYVYRLFPNKEALFLAVVEHAFDLVRDSLARGAAAAASTDPELVLRAMADSYAELISDQNLILVQLHAQAAAAAEPTVREAVRAGYARVVEYVRSVSGASEPQVQNFFAVGMLCHLIVAIDASSVDAPWARVLSAGIKHV
ncbi:TetR/AcrR family transcriptional regulator [Kutzneria buriramensis]|uniref:AcrR family transcriptional regulator n=1 Tax=Kutzneria buriramensis TaxID=1045776 RepID=A0A3E0GXU5_9PSEU|nr:TetR/AcrR family transcriptional regulator [Kutzneria buriramensis]REH33054.1 AcrR family transcriptional regulator [Kutzneria buriramensis]